MTISVLGSPSTYVNTANGGSDSWLHTVTGAPDGVLVLFAKDALDAASPITAVTYGGVSMTEITGLTDDSPYDSIATEVACCYAFWLDAAIPTGDQTVAFTQTNTSNKLGVCITYSADGTATIQELNGDTGRIQSPSDTIALSGNACHVASIAQNGSATPTNISPFTDWTEIIEVDAGTHAYVAYTYDVISTSDVAFGHTTGNVQDYVMIAIAIKDTGAGAPSGNPWNYYAQQ